MLINATDLLNRFENFAEVDLLPQLNQVYLLIQQAFTDMEDNIHKKTIGDLTNNALELLDSFQVSDVATSQVVSQHYFACSFTHVPVDATAFDVVWYSTREQPLVRLQQEPHVPIVEPNVFTPAMVEFTSQVDACFTSQIKGLVELLTYCKRFLYEVEDANAPQVLFRYIVEVSGAFEKLTILFELFNEINSHTNSDSLWDVVICKFRNFAQSDITMFNEQIDELLDFVSAASAAITCK